MRGSSIHSPRACVGKSEFVHVWWFTKGEGGGASGPLLVKSVETRFVLKTMFAMFRLLTLYTRHTHSARRSLASLWASAMDELPLSTQMTHSRKSPASGSRDIEDGVCGAIGTPPRLGGTGWLVKVIAAFLCCSFCLCTLLAVVAVASTPALSQARRVFVSTPRPNPDDLRSTNGAVRRSIDQKPLPSVLKQMTLITRASAPDHGPDLHSVGQAFPHWCEGDCWEDEFIWKPEEVQKDLIMAVAALVNRLPSSEKHYS